MYVRVSSSFPNVTAVMVSECVSDRTTVYGFLPPLIVRPKGSHVESVSETLACTIADEDASEDRHEVSLLAGPRSAVCEYIETARHTCHGVERLRYSSGIATRVDNGQHQRRAFGKYPIRCPSELQRDSPH